MCSLTEAGKPFTANSTKTSCDARPDHTFGSLSVDEM
jgi:hypothetical protein